MKKPSRRNGPSGAGPRLKWALLSPTRFAGTIHDPADPERRFAVELLLDGVAVALARADIFDADLADRNSADSGHGFAFSLDAAALHSARLAEIRLANGDSVLWPPLQLSAIAASIGEAKRAGAVRWLGGLRFAGWLDVLGGETQRVRASIDGEIVADAAADGWTHIGEGRDVAAVRGFDLHLPERFADGRAHFAQVVDGSGRELPGSPCFFAAFDDGLARFLEDRGEIASEKLRGEAFDRLIPRSLPFSDFAQWRARFARAAPEQGGGAPKIGVALIGDLDVEASIASLEAQQGCEWVAAALEGGEGEAEFPESAFPNALLREFLDRDASDCETVVFARSGAVFEPAGLALLHRALALFPDAPAAYCDFTLVMEDGGEWPVALSAFDYERMLEQGFCAHIFALRGSVARAAALSGADNLYRLFNFSQDGVRSKEPRGDPAANSGLALGFLAPVHAPGFLARLPRCNVVEAGRALARANEAHFAAQGGAAKIEPGSGALFPAVRVTRAASHEKVSILVAARDRIDLLKPCLDALFATVDVAHHEVILLDNDSSDPETLACLDAAAARGVRILRVGGPFDFARIVNKGAAVASHELLLLLNHDVEALGSGWLEEMLGRIVEPDVGAVGAALLWPNGVVRHGGVVLGPGFDAACAFADRIEDDPGYADLLRAAHEVSALTAACLLTRRQLFLDLGGLDGREFPLHYNDVDYCLKLRARGLRLVLTPHARLLRHAASSGRDFPPESLKAELRHLRNVWGEVLLADPYYNPQLSLDRTPFAGLAWPPRPLEPRQPASPPSRVSKA